MSTLPAVDVIIATHNRPDLLRIALDAVWNQTYEGEIAITVVFDQSEPDPSLERAGENRSLRVITNADRTPGLAGARNAGILATDNPLVAFCDDDDEWLSTKVAQQVGALTSSDALTSVTGIVINYGDHDTTRVPSQEEVTLEQLVRRRVMEAHPSTVMVRRDALLGPIGLVDEEIPGSYGEDYDWIIRAARAGRFAVVEDALVKVRWGQSLFSRKWQTIVEATDYLLDKHPEFRADKAALSYQNGRRAFAFAASGQRGSALRTSMSTLRLNPFELRAYLATAVALRLVSAERLMDMAHRRGRGI